MKSCESFLRKSQFSKLRYLPKSWIWWTLGHVRNIFCKCHLHNTSKKVFQPQKNLNSIHGFKSAILPVLKNCQNGPDFWGRTSRLIPLLMLIPNAYVYLQPNTYVCLQPNTYFCLQLNTFFAYNQSICSVPSKVVWSTWLRWWCG